MTLKNWWKSKQYWVKGGIIGFIVSIIIEVVFIYFIGGNVLCVEPLKCTDYLRMFVSALLFFAPVGLLAGLIVGAIIDKIKSSKNK